MGIKFADNARTQLTAGIITTTTQFPIDAADDSLFPIIASIGADYFYITFEDEDHNIEQVKIVQHVSGSNILNCDVVGNRAQGGTTAKNYDIGDVVEVRPTKLVLEDLATELQALITAAQNAADAAQADADTAQATADGHIADATDAHDASAISFTPAGEITSNEVQAALQQLDALRSFTLVETKNPSSSSNESFTGLSPNTIYRCVFTLIGGALSSGIRFNSDSGANYLYAILGLKTDGTVSNSNSAGDSRINMSGSLEPNMHGEFFFNTSPDDATIVLVHGRVSMLGGIYTFAGKYDGAADLTSMQFVAMLGNLTGTISLYKMKQ